MFASARATSDLNNVPPLTPTHTSMWCLENKSLFICLQ